MWDDLIRTWGRVAAHGWNVGAFADEGGGKGHLKACAGVVAGALVGLAVSVVLGEVTGASKEGFRGLASIYTSRARPPVGSWLVVVPIGVVYGFYLFEVILWVAARRLGGRGSFGLQAYMQSLFYAPLSIAQQAAVQVPGTGRWLFFVLAVCSLWPTTTSLRAAHGYSTARAVTTWLIPVALNVAIVAVVIGVVKATRG